MGLFAREYVYIIFYLISTTRIALMQSKEMVFGAPCMSQSCVKAASSILSNMDTSVNPCQDFYKFACGKFDEKYVSYPSIDATRLEYYKHQRDIKQLMKEVMYSGANDMTNLRLFQSSCMNANFTHSAQIESILSALREIGDWPTLDDDFDEEKFDWVDRSQRMFDLGMASATVVTIGLNTNDDEAPQFAVKSFKVLLSDFKDYSHLLENKKLPRSKRIRRLHLGGNSPHLLLEGISLADNLRNVTVPCQSNDKRDQILTVKELYNASSRIDWIHYINHQYSPHEIRMNDSIFIDNCTYSIIPEIFTVLDSAPKRTVATWMLMTIAVQLINRLNDYAAIQRSHKISPYLLKQFKILKCLQTSLEYFPLQILKLYHEKYISPQTKPIVLQMMVKLYRRLQLYQFRAPWISNATRTRLARSLAGIKIQLFLPAQDVYNKITGQLNQFLQLSPDNLLQNLLQLTYARQKLRLFKLFKKNRDYFFDMSVFRTNIKTLSAHLYVFFVGAAPSLFRSIYFDVHRPVAMNYGSLGYFLSHELTHAINRHFIELSTIAKSDKDSHTAFMKRATCVSDKYSQFVAEDLNIRHNGSATLSEDLADTNGIRLAYKTYQTWVKENGSDYSLPGLNFTPPQLFWLSMANCFCRTDITYMWKSPKADAHSHHRFRILGMASNSPEFSTDFGCPLGSPMNPESKCELWVE